MAEDQQVAGGNQVERGTEALLVQMVPLAILGQKVKKENAEKSFFSVVTIFEILLIYVLIYFTCMSLYIDFCIHRICMIN